MVKWDIVLDPTTLNISSAVYKQKSPKTCPFLSKCFTGFTYWIHDWHSQIQDLWMSWKNVVLGSKHTFRKTHISDLHYSITREYLVLSWTSDGSSFLVLPPFLFYCLRVFFSSIWKLPCLEVNLHHLQSQAFPLHVWCYRLLVTSCVFHVGQNTQVGKVNIFIPINQM